MALSPTTLASFIMDPASGEEFIDTKLFAMLSHQEEPDPVDEDDFDVGMAATIIDFLLAGFQYVENKSTGELHVEIPDELEPRLYDRVAALYLAAGWLTARAFTNGQTGTLILSDRPAPVFGE